MSLENEQLSFDSEQKENKRVTVLGMEFENDDARREYFREELRKKLPDLRGIEGFPIGNDENIIELSNPPFYTACPNPWISDLIDEWSADKPGNEYHREPFTSDVSEGKSDRIYNIHSYHTKVPHKAVMRYILHYTNPGDIILDGFSGTGMTGVATKYTNSREEVEKLGYYVNEKNEIFDDSNEVFSQLGERHSVLTELSPAASLISNSYNENICSEDFKNKSESILAELNKETSWLFMTEDKDGNIVPINYSVWSDVFLCPNCDNELVFWDIAVDMDNKEMKKEMSCPFCKAIVTKKDMKQVFVSKFDNILSQVINVPKQEQVLINYSNGSQKINKRPTQFDFELQKRIEDYDIAGFVPINAIIAGDETDRLKKSGIRHVFQLYSKRNLIVMSVFYEKIRGTKYFGEFLNILRSSNSYSTKMVKVNVPRLLDKGGVFSFGFVSGTLYIPSLNGERPVLDAIKSKTKSMIAVIDGIQNSCVVSNQSTTDLRNIRRNSIDYIFVDPPFGANLMYSELNYSSESWMNLFTNNSQEAIMNNMQNKAIGDYKYLMSRCFSELYRVLKPGRWMTVEFSNSKANVWNSIQEAIQNAGFIIANVAALDKKQGSFKAVTTTTAVKQDLVISAYKPTEENIEKMKAQRNNVESAWTFVTQHLSNLPVFMGDKGDAVIISERTPRILFDRMVAYHVQQGLPVPVSSADFQSGIASRYPMRDGMAFLDSQVAEYDKKRILAKEFAQLSLFVSDENSAIEWIRQQLMKKPQSRQDIHPQFMKEIQHIAKYEELPELDELLAQNFLYYDGNGAVPNQISTYLTKNYHDLRGLEKDDALLREKAKNRWYVPNPNQQADLEKLREKNLLREFGHYLDEINNSKKKLKAFRTEAIRVGFKKAWTEKEYQTIVTVGERLPEKVIQEDDKLLMYYDNALMRTEM
jgi:DNA modification methylase